MTTETTRRAILGGTGLAAVALAVPALASSTSYAAKMSPELARLISERAAAAAVLDRWCDEFEAKAARVREQKEGVPHITMEGGPRMGGGTIVWTTADPLKIASAKGLASVEPRPDHVESLRISLENARSFYAAHLQREEQLQEISRAAGLNKAQEKEARLSDPVIRCDQAIEAFPCASMADLRAKLAHIDATGTIDSNPHGILRSLMTDAARLSGEAA